MEASHPLLERMYEASTIEAALISAWRLGQHTFICSSFNNAFPVCSNYIVLNERVISTWMMKWKGSGCGLILKYSLSICVEKLRKTMKKIRISRLWAETWIWDLPNIKQKC
jgi:hypothetical protein